MRPLTIHRCAEGEQGGGGRAQAANFGACRKEQRYRLGKQLTVIEEHGRWRKQASSYLSASLAEPSSNSSSTTPTEDGLSASLLLEPRGRLQKKRDLKLFGESGGVGGKAT